MQVAKVAVASILLATLFGCSRANDDAESAREADRASGADVERSETSLENRSAVYGNPGNTPTEASEDDVRSAPVGVGMSAPGTGNTREEMQPTGPGTAGAGVTTGGPGAVNSPTGASGSPNIGN